MQPLDGATIRSIVDAKPYSRVPVCRGGDRNDVLGVVIVKDLLAVLSANLHPPVAVGQLKIRHLPRSAPVVRFECS